MIRKPEFVPKFLDRFLVIVQDQLTSRLGPSEAAAFPYCAQWSNSKGQLTLEATHLLINEYELIIRCSRQDGSFLRTWFSGGNQIMRFSVGYVDSPRKTFELGLFEWFVNNCIEETVKLYLS